MRAAINAQARSRGARQCQAGITLVEVLVSLVVLSIGLFGIFQLYAAGQQSELASQQHAEALVVVNDMVDRINANRSAAGCYAITDGSGGTAFVGTGNSTNYTCAGVDTSATRAVADEDLDDWGRQVKALVGGRGCIYDDGSADSYRVVVVWQGRRLSDDPDANCAQGEYGGLEDGQSRRRAISRTVRIADLD
jgi:type IV pilus assembly protein PilV